MKKWVDFFNKKRQGKGGVVQRYKFSERILTAFEKGRSGYTGKRD